MASLVVVVGGISRRPRAIGDRVEVREVLDLTVTVDHDVVDGAPATRFAAHLRQLMTTAAVLTPAEPSPDPPVPCDETRSAEVVGGIRPTTNATIEGAP